MDWDEFRDLLGGLNETTPLVRVAQIRLETDKDVIKEFTPQQRQMNSQWKKKAAQKRSKQDLASFLESMQKVFAGMSGEYEESR